MVDPEERSATCTSATSSGAVPKTFDTCTCAEVPPMLVCTIWRSVCWLKDWPPLSGDADQVPVQGVLAAMLFTAKAPPAAVIRAAPTMAAHKMASSRCGRRGHETEQRGCRSDMSASGRLVASMPGREGNLHINTTDMLRLRHI